MPIDPRDPLGHVARQPAPHEPRTRRGRAAPSRISSTKTTAAISATSSGCALSTGGMSMRSRIEFCHSAARQTKATTIDRRDRRRGPGRRRARSRSLGDRQLEIGPEPAQRARRGRSRSRSRRPPSTPCSRKLRGISDGVSEAARNSAPISSAEARERAPEPPRRGRPGRSPAAAGRGRPVRAPAAAAGGGLRRASAAPVGCGGRRMPSASRGCGGTGCASMLRVRASALTAARRAAANRTGAGGVAGRRGDHSSMTEPWRSTRPLPSARCARRCAAFDLFLVQAALMIVAGLVALVYPLVTTLAVTLVPRLDADHLGRRAGDHA